MKKICTVSKKEFEITDADLEFYKKINVPPPTLCPTERRRRRLAWRNERNLYRRKCDGTGQSIVSVFPPEVPFPVFKNTHWWGDAWDGLDFGRDFDFSRDFFPQFFELYSVVPQIATMNDHSVKSENCEFCQDFSNGKNCFLVSGSWFIRDSMYSDNCNHCTDVVDCTSVNLKCELVYESLNCQHVYSSAFLENCENCSDCWFGLELKGCKNCFGCVNLRQKEFHIFNEPHTREEYFEKLKKFDSGSHAQVENMKQYFSQFSQKFPRKFAQLLHCENCTGDQLFHCKDFNGFESFNSQDSKFIDRVDSSLWSYDIIQTGKPSWCCDCVTPDGSWMVVFSNWCWNCKNLACCDNCHSCEDCFGCVGLKRKKFCIFNQQFSESEYHELREKIISKMTETGEWGELFPIKFSPFPYNETQAFEHFPLSKSDVSSRGWKWRDDPEISKTAGQEIPDHISKIDDDWLKKILVCEISHKKFKLEKQELNFYRKMKLPIPRICPRARHENRRKKLPLWKLFSRKCDACAAEISSPFSPDSPERIFCEKCYLDFVG
ncbi:hypothetical protein HN954_02960 [bacterium]|nr:hypothetical protein [bacterium]MBT6831458.1 hypothetical protein [bacterium]MBT6996364.1 hypothetical protein [bacterium]MBT7772431.1 hypothetical protein [bacterium]